MTQPLFASAGVFARNQSQIASNLFPTTKTLGWSNNQDESQPGKRAHPGMSHQPYHRSLFLGLLLDGGAELRDRRVESVEQFE